MAPSRVLSGTAKLGLCTMGVAAALAAATGTSFAQSGAKAAAPAAPVVAADPAVLQKGRQIFTDYGCASCHALADAGADGHVGPGLDNNSSLSVDFVTNRVTNGQGLMPSFSGQLNADEIAAVAAYVVSASAK